MQRHLRNRIVELEDETGRRTTSTSECLKVASDYFEKLFTVSDVGSDEHLFGLVERQITDSMNEKLLHHFTEEDIFNGVQSMAPLKAPGVDGFPALFFQKYWHIIGSDVSSYCLSILNGQAEVGYINKT